jgi:hypothetical protein
MPATDTRRSMGRPPIGPAVTYRVPEEIKEYVDGEAASRGLKAADVWREITLDAVARRRALRRRRRPAGTA